MIARAAKYQKNERGGEVYTYLALSLEIMI
jgi:hypothetical protein